MRESHARTATYAPGTLDRHLHLLHSLFKPSSRMSLCARIRLSRAAARAGGDDGSGRSRAGRTSRPWPRARGAKVIRNRPDQAENAPVAQWIEQRFPKPRALVRFRPGALRSRRPRVAREDRDRNCAGHDRGFRAYSTPDGRPATRTAPRLGTTAAAVRGVRRAPRRRPSARPRNGRDRPPTVATRGADRSRSGASSAAKAVETAAAVRRRRRRGRRGGRGTAHRATS